MAQLKNALLLFTLLFATAFADALPSAILDYYSEEYESARGKFLDAVRKNDGRIESHPCPVKGPDGETLYIDVARFGAEDPDTVLVLSSGTHGVEGFAGSAIQTGLLLHGIAKSLPPDVSLVMIHILNPYGMAHLRRVNEENIDLNRNFLDHSKPHPSNAGYAELADTVAPDSLSFWEDIKALARLFGFWVKHNTAELKHVLTSGQYTHPDGIFYGGLEPAWSNETLSKIAERHLFHAKRVVAVDIHTGLGAYGSAEVIMNVGRSAPAYRRAERWWGNRVASTVEGKSVSEHLHGTLKLSLETMLPESEITAVGLEFGTLPGYRVLWALRSENWLHHHGNGSCPESSAIKNDLLRAFYPDDDAWKLEVWRQGKEVVEQAIEGLNGTK